MRDAGADGLWVHPSVDFRYLTGLELLSIERPAGLLIPAQGEVRAAAPAMFAEPLAGDRHRAVDDADGPEAALARVLGGLRTLLVAPSLPTGQSFLLRARPPGAGAGARPGHRRRRYGAARRRRRSRCSPRRAGAPTRRWSWIGTLDLDGWSERRLAGELQAQFLRGGAAALRPDRRHRRERRATAPRDGRGADRPRPPRC